MLSIIENYEEIWIEINTLIPTIESILQVIAFLLWVKKLKPESGNTMIAHKAMEIRAAFRRLGCSGIEPRCLQGHNEVQIDII
ncbi:MAG: hypothetical protein O7I42_10940 [Alphaproteobacteria bacterium]|nr:hypothetical protein [Alphaproteobacteria bacterium]